MPQRMGINPPVTFNDDDPKKGFFTLFLTMKEMKVKKSLFGKNMSTNTVFNEDEIFKNTALCIIGKVTTKDGDIIEYQYNKGLPENINVDQCSYKLKNDQIILSVCKSESVSWAQHARYLITRDE